MMKLQAVTVCINYADYLAAIIPNRRHFDRWVIMTVLEDQETIQLCEQHNLEYRISERLRSDGSDFNAAKNKSLIVNEGLDALDQCGWALLLDADVRLPRHFRERFNAWPLKHGTLFGTAGRTICPERRMYDMLVHCEPWDWCCERHIVPFGFFQLFSLEVGPNRYLPSDPLKKGPADDHAFAGAFPTSIQRTLPLTVLHVGRAHQNWNCRIVERFDQQVELESGDEGEANEASELFRGTIAMVGYYPGSRVNQWLANCEHVHLLDHFQVHVESGDPFIEANRQALRELWSAETGKLLNLEEVGPHSTSSLAKINDSSLDLVYLPGEITPDWLVAALPLWLEKLRDGGVICGDLFGLPHWPDSTHAISLLLGPPDRVCPSGFWWKRIERTKSPRTSFPLRFPVRVEASSALVETGNVILLINQGEQRLPALCLTLHSLRQQWTGHIVVYHSGKPNPALAIACSRYAVDLLNAGEALRTQSGGDEDLIREATAFSRCARTLVLPSGTLISSKLSSALVPGLENRQICSGDPHLVLNERGLKRRLGVNFADSRDGVSLLTVFNDDPGTWSEEAWEAWCANEAAMTSALACPVRTPADTLVVCIVDRNTLATFEQSWLTWQFGRDTPVCVILDGLHEDEVWFANGHRPERLISVDQSSRTNDICSSLRQGFAPAFVFLISPKAVPLPGASIPSIARDNGARSLLHLAKPATSTLATGWDHDTETALFAVVNWNTALNAFAEAQQYQQALAVSAREALSTGSQVQFFDAQRLGWRFVADSGAAVFPPCFRSASPAR